MFHLAGVVVHTDRIRLLIFTSYSRKLVYLLDHRFCGVTRRSLGSRGTSYYIIKCSIYLQTPPSHRKKREAKIKRDVKRGIREPNEQDPFEIFITVTDIRYT